MAESASFPVLWVGLEERPVELANVFMGQFLDDEFIITIGSVSPPMLSDTKGDAAEQIRKMGPVPITPVARLGMSERRMRELIEVLQNTLKAQARANGDSA